MMVGHMIVLVSAQMMAKSTLPVAGEVHAVQTAHTAGLNARETAVRNVIQEEDVLLVPAKATANAAATGMNRIIQMEDIPAVLG